MPLNKENTANTNGKLILLNTDTNRTTATPGLQSKLYTIITVWFFWGFVAASNGIFIPFCKTHFQLNQAQSQEIELAFYGAYFAGSLLLWLLSQLFGFDIITRFGYKKAIIYGLLISLLGTVPP
jgi:FHS family L-fucose permease-like MFS transporter